MQFDSFYKYDELTEFLRELETSRGDLLKVHTLTQSAQGRDVYLAEITDFSTGSSINKSAYYIQGGLHAIEGAGVTAALHVLYSLVCDETRRELLRDVAFYIVPCVDPDGMEIALTAHADIRSRFHLPERNNQLVPHDVNGDGLILQMRWPSTFGAFKENPQQPGQMIKRGAGDVEGVFYQVVQEGIVKNHDGGRSISPAQPIDFNRSYPVHWDAMGIGTAYPFSQPEMKAIADFMVQHPNIFAGVDFHCGTHAILRSHCKEDHEIHSADLQNINYVGKLAEQITGFPYMDGTKYGYGGRGGMRHGTSNDWAYLKLGLSHYVVEVGYGFTSLGLTPQEILGSDEKAREEFTRQLIDLHREKGREILQPWKKFTHPQLGEIEVGGLMVGDARFMYPRDMETAAPKTTEFVLRHAALRPHLILSDIETVALGENLYRIRATVGNVGGFSTEIMKGSAHEKPAVKVRLIGENIEILSRHRVHEIASLEAVCGSREVEWFVKIENAAPEIMIQAQHPRSGIVQQTIRL